MATSGTVGQTTFTLAQVIDLALRRCQLNPTMQTVEIVESIRSALYLLLTSLANRGLNLWRVEHGFLGLAVGQNRYDLPVSTIRIANLNFVTNTAATGTLSSIVGGYQFLMSENFTTSRIGFQPTSTFTAALEFLSTTDGVTYTSQSSLASATYQAGRWYWFDLPTNESIQGIQITSTDSFTLTEISISSQNFVIPMWQWNRDDYSRQPVRVQGGRPSTNFYFDRQINAQLWLWPNVQNQYDHLEYWLHRHIEDITLLTEEIDVPTHWLNAMTWQLAKEITFIFPGIPPDVKSTVMMEADRSLIDAEAGETDGSSMFLQPVICGYTRTG